ncbi:hypothetical protein Pint_09541 [Pistacia integerrima]|uniref:Uncharacterized protein n=1 Tax=Pistacia integerrima TaxID=434235 RepID=A0ACC0XIN1_9ROSI|nr:hypothetical protein Pint_09541 [Pistacia integerrima]
MANPKYKTSGIPLDLIYNILYKLPAKTLLRFRCLSKPFCSLIASPDFIKLHFSHYISSRLNFIVKDLSLYSSELNSFDNIIQLNDLREETKVFGSCKSFLALSDPHLDISLFNPLNGILFELPFPREDFHGDCVSRVAFLGFGYDHVNDHYKVVRIVRFRFEHGDGSWFTDYEVKIEEDMEFLFQVVYTGYFLVVPIWVQPYNPDFEKDDVLELVVLMGRLCLVSMYDEGILDVWMMKEYRVKESWFKLISIDRSNTTNSFSFLNPLPCSEWRGDEFILEVGEEHVLYNLKRESVKTEKSFFQAEGEKQEEEQEESKEQKRKKR